MQNFLTQSSAWQTQLQPDNELKLFFGGGRRPRLGENIIVTLFFSGPDNDVPIPRTVGRLRLVANEFVRFPESLQQWGRIRRLNEHHSEVGGR